MDWSLVQRHLAVLWKRNQSLHSLWHSWTIKVSGRKKRAGIKADRKTEWKMQRQKGRVRGWWMWKRSVIEDPMNPCILKGQKKVHEGDWERNEKEENAKEENETKERIPKWSWDMRMYSSVKEAVNRHILWERSENRGRECDRKRKGSSEKRKRRNKSSIVNILRIMIVCRSSRALKKAWILICFMKKRSIGREQRTKGRGKKPKRKRKQKGDLSSKWKEK